jgi:hypothetical protein
MATVSKEKQQNSYYPHYSDYCGVKCCVFRVKVFTKMINYCVEELNDTEIKNIHHFKKRKIQNFVNYLSIVMILEPKPTFLEPYVNYKELIEI